MIQSLLLLLLRCLVQSTSLWSLGYTPWPGSAIITDQKQPGITGLFNPNGDFRLDLTFWLIGVGLPTEFPPASIPIAPTSFHPEGRGAAEPSAPLPWENLYFHTWYSCSAVVSRVYLGADPCGSSIYKQARDDFMDIQSDDLELMTLKRNAVLSGLDPAVRSVKSSQRPHGSSCSWIACYACPIHSPKHVCCRWNHHSR